MKNSAEHSTFQYVKEMDSSMFAIFIRELNDVINRDIYPRNKKLQSQDDYDDLIKNIYQDETNENQKILIRNINKAIGLAQMEMRE